jgi:hypothetical protein
LPDLLRSTLTTFANALMSAEVMAMSVINQPPGSQCHPGRINAGLSRIL